MNVLLVVPGGITADGAGDTIPVLNQFVHSLKSSCNVCVLSVDDRPRPTRERAQGFTIVNPGRHRNRITGIYTDAGNASRMLSENRVSFDVIHSFWLGRPSSIAWLLSKRHKKPWVASVGGQEFYWQRIRHAPLLHRISRRLQNRIALKYSDELTAGSRLLVDALQKLGRSARWWPLFPPKRQSADDEPDDRRTQKTIRIITIADHNQTKDPRTLLRTIQLLKARKLGIELYWIGREIEPGHAQSLADEFGISDLVHIVGHVPHENIPDYLGSADIYLQSSKYESQGVAVCEAAMHGLPLIGTAVGILREFAPSGAITAEPGNASGLADAVESVVKDSELRRALGGGAAAWMEGYSMDWTTRQAIEIYRTLAPGSH